MFMGSCLYVPPFPYYGAWSRSPTLHLLLIAGCYAWNAYLVLGMFIPHCTRCATQILNMVLPTNEGTPQDYSLHFVSPNNSCHSHSGHHCHHHFFKRFLHLDGLHCISQANIHYMVWLVRSCYIDLNRPCLFYELPLLQWNKNPNQLLVSIMGSSRWTQSTSILFILVKPTYILFTVYIYQILDLIHNFCPILEWTQTSKPRRHLAVETPPNPGE